MASSAAASPVLPVTRSNGGGASSAQPRLSQGGTPPGRETTAGTRVMSNRRNRRGSNAIPASAPPSRAPAAPIVARMPPPGSGPRSNSGTPARAASAAHCRQLASGTDRLMNTRTVAPLPPGRLAEIAPAPCSAGSGVPPGFAEASAAASAASASVPARVKACSCTRSAHSPKPTSRASASERISPASACASETASAFPAALSASHASGAMADAGSASTGGASAAAVGGAANTANNSSAAAPRRAKVPARRSALFSTKGSNCVSSTAGSRNSRPTRGFPAGTPKTPRTARWGCSPPPAPWPEPGRPSASGTGFCA